ncbi:acetylornithine deacetylase/succinyl-diaminopimelate desuccinylase-like protein [Sphingomonas zeicaulis]|uniref:M20/M25/M40 family metallo-hydrolase n=1 Tax=Sphingomonas zeicaulis TaxID=1632740 RepID=UPI003D1DDF0D
MSATLFLLAAAATASPPAQPEPAAPPALVKLLASERFDAAKTALRADHERLVAEIIALTEIPAPPFGEAERGRAYADLMRKSGFTDVTTDPVGNVIAIRPGKNRKLGPLIVAAHLDTVFPKGTDVKVKREGTRLMAPGIGDDSRGLAVLLAFRRALDKAGIETDRDIMFVGNVGEEGPGDLRGMRHLFGEAQPGRKAAAFISVDSSGAETIVTRGVGSRRHHIIFNGPGGHSFDKFGIVNPMVPLAKTVTGLYGITVPGDPRTTYSASVVGGGTSVNTIPPRVFLDVDIRSVSPAEVERVDRELRAIVDRAVAEENATRDTSRGTVSVTFERIGERPAGQTDETAGLGALAFAASRAFGYKTRFIPVSTDANVPMNLGIPAIAIGSGGSGGAEHSPDEWIDVEIEESVRGMSAGLATVIAAASR